MYNQKKKKEKKPYTIIQKDTSTPMFIAAFTKVWKQPKRPSAYEWIKKTWPIYAMEYYSTVKKNEVMPFAATWMALEGMMLVKSGGERQILYNTTYVWNLKTTKTSEQNKKEADSQIQRTSGSQRGREGGGATEGRGGGRGLLWDHVKSWVRNF